MTNDFLPLDQLLSGSRMSVPDLVRYAIHIAAAVRRLHADGRCHGGLSVQSIEVSHASARLRPAELGEFQELTPYTAPETLLGEVVDTRSDIFSFGAILYEMATGRRAFAAEDADALKEEIITHAVSPIGHPGLDHVVSHCLAKDPAVRWQKMQKVQTELKLVGLAEQQSETSLLVHLENAMSEELAKHAHALAELNQNVTSRTLELRETVAAALEDVQSQFAEVEKFLAASEQRTDHFAQATAQAVETAQRELAALHVELAGEVSALADLSKGQATSIETIKTSIAWNEDCVERVVDALDGLQSVIFKQPPVAKAVPISIAS